MKLPFTFYELYNERDLLKGRRRRRIGEQKLGHLGRSVQQSDSDKTSVDVLALTLPTTQTTQTST